ncbi:segregation and condensation protein B [Salinibacter ruber]|uniref:SMC-Scp complex subunit ScpB n=1 Tax=Salinibacter ruber TaxID=146919 RepID=UPI00216852DD|nr:SMC-Scp complex subunit ScpB [Salinibacter ruber]MCS3828418.1 segregation and condensation protein B [Salinibacter ruber]MCS4054706.1 segregation and condensation protein B [Salinibacter ruber]MCS4057962.1 segregation and condensation protein B [Salinibacter ruber]MCS4162788.1 segregation and condensation protein B [Salinibacter ruber]
MPDDASPESPEASAHSPDRPAKADDHTLVEAAEAILFAADEPVSASRIATIVGDVTGRSEPSEDDVAAALDRLNATYEEHDRAFEVKSWAGGYRMVTRAPLSPYAKTFYVEEQETTLSRSLMETLAVIAYRQPVTRPEVDFVRGVNSDYAIRKLLEMDLASVEGRAESVGRPLLYGTTDRFLEQFGLDALDDLPTLREVEDLLDDPAFDDERAKLLQLDREEGISVDMLDAETGDSPNGDSPNQRPTE